MPKKRPLILVTNDDGITAPGIRTLIEVMNTIGEVYVVAPDAPQSGMGHAITINDTLYCNSMTVVKGEPQIEYSCSGTPVDCVKIAVNEILKENSIREGDNDEIITYEPYWLKVKQEIEKL